MAELVKLPSHERNPSASSQGPMESARQGIGRRLPVAILKASERSSTQLLMRKLQPASGHATEKSDRYPKRPERKKKGAVSLIGQEIKRKSGRDLRGSTHSWLAVRSRISGFRTYRIGSPFPCSLW